MPNPVKHFEEVAPKYMALLLKDFPELSLEDAAAIFGNAGHESIGLTTLQEMKPTVEGSRGGWGWMQWTGPRRKAFEAYCAKHKYDVRSDEANYKWLFLELKGIEGTEKPIPKLLAAKGLEAKVIAFEKAFLRAGVKHYDSRLVWAERALAAWNGRPMGEVKPPALEPAPKPKPASTVTHDGTKRGWSWVVPVVAIAALIVWFVFFKR